MLRATIKLAVREIPSSISTAVLLDSFSHARMWSTHRQVAAGDVVIVWQTRELIQPLLITPGKELNNKFGHYKHSDLVGISYGSRVASRNGRGFIHVLRPTPELWTMALPHRTQILYLSDIAFITSWLDVRCGSRVIEAGTGSGSFSHSIARTVGPSGQLYSYEFHEARAEKAREEFVRHGMEDIVTLTHRNVCKDGFTVENLVDSVFLDLPAPWDAISHAKRALRKDRPTRICCFSPCMEQVLRTIGSLNEAGFTDITMYETLLRPHEVQRLPVPLPLSHVIDQLKKMEKYREEKRLRQIANNKRKREEDIEPCDPDKRPRTDGSNCGGSTNDPPATCTPLPETSGSKINNDVTGAAYSLSKVCHDVRGHTSYLTFARLVPYVVDTLGVSSPADPTHG